MCFLRKKSTINWGYLFTTTVCVSQVREQLWGQISPSTFTWVAIHSFSDLCTSVLVPRWAIFPQVFLGCWISIQSNQQTALYTSMPYTSMADLYIVSESGLKAHTFNPSTPEAEALVLPTCPGLFLVSGAGGSRHRRVPLVQGRSRNSWPASPTETISKNKINQMLSRKKQRPRHFKESQKDPFHLDQQILIFVA